MKKKYLILSVIVITIGIAVWFKEPIVKAAGGVFALSSAIQNPSNPSGAALAVSGLNYMTPGAGTTTITQNTQGIEQFDVYVFGVASSTLTNLRYRVEFSNSTSTIPADQLWFPEPNNYAPTTTTVTVPQSSQEYSYRFASSTPHRLATSTAMNTTFDENTTFAFTHRIENIAARWVRVVFYVPTMGITRALTTALGEFLSATSTNVGIYVAPLGKEPF